MAPEERRNELISAVLRSIIKNGHDGLSVRTVCQEAGVSAGLLTHHFPGKDALITEAYRTITRDIYAGIDEKLNAVPDATSLDKLRLFIETSFTQPVLNQDFLKIWLVFWNLSQQNPEIATLRNNVSIRVMESLQELIEGTLAELSISGINSRLTSIGLSALMDGLWLEWSLNPETFTPEEATEICQCWVDSLINNGLGRLK